MRSATSASGWASSLSGAIALFLGASIALLGGCSRDVDTRQLRELALAADRVLSPYEASPEANRLVDDATDAVRHLDAAALYSTLPAGSTSDRARRVLFDVRHDDGRRRLRIEVPDSPVASHDFFETRSLAVRGPGELPGDGWLLLGVLPLADSSKRYRLRATSALSTGAADSFALWRSLPDGLARLESENPSLVADLRARFPRALSFLLRYVELRRLASASAGGRTDVELRMRARFDAFGERYPSLSAFLFRVAHAVRASGLVEDAGGRTLASWRNGTAEEGMAVALSLRDGRLAPKSGGPAVDLLSPLDLRFSYAATVERYGIKTTIEGIHGTLRTDPAAPSRSIGVAIHGDPTRLTVEGAILGVVPVEVVDVLIPGSVEEAAKSILSTVLRGRDGRGVELLTELGSESAERHRVTSTLFFDVPSGELTRIALRLGAALMQLSAAERAEAVRFGRDLIAELESDLSSAKVAHR